MIEADMTYEKIDRTKTDAVLKLLLHIAEGPREAYGILTVCIHRLNFEMNDTPASVDLLCAEVAATLRSITDERKFAQ